MKNLKCPNCGATLSIHGNRSQFFCEYCGAKIYDDNGRVTYETVERYIDEAEVKRIELEAEKFRAEQAKESTPYFKSLLNDARPIIFYLLAGVGLMLFMRFVFLLF